MMTLSVTQEPPQDRRGYQVPLLRALAEHTSEMWCLTALAEPRLTACSQRFFDLWEIPSAFAAAGIGLLSTRTAEMISAGGLYRDQLPPLAEFTKALFRSADTGAAVIRFGTLDVWLYDVPDQNGGLAGRLAFLRTRTDGNSEAAVRAAAVRAAEILQRLSAREQEVVDQLFAGATNRQISQILRISEKTVEKHRANAMSRLEVRTFAELIRLVAAARLPT